MKIDGMVVSYFGAQGGSTPILFTLIIIAAIAGLRIRRMRNGTRVSKGRTIGYVGVLGAISSLFIVESIYSIGVSPLFVIPYAATIASSAYFGYKYSKKSLVFSRAAPTGDSGSSSSIFVKGGIAIFAIYIAAMIARIMIGFLFVGTSGFFSFNGTATGSVGQTAYPPIDSAAYLGSVVTDFLMMFGAGLFLGRNVRIYRHYSMIQKGEVSI